MVAQSRATLQQALYLSNARHLQSRLHTCEMRGRHWQSGLHARRVIGPPPGFYQCVSTA